ncbi:FtsW/RodA/SpoVE family cell cycle protein [Paenibacillus harenae]|uniref:FtsW/RodA/SpoVE family cell cycle protein n=1 Tax=Paenibacillus harenae TaxID=306543 RepID=UPI00278FC9B9|nr:FtsW/RodA/SpoVE family cell cycle protein [Paenibacillus harenae]MDQ0063905.1 cell division protein FtsW (lipid II flippase) [Paenibacillus harenae]
MSREIDQHPLVRQYLESVCGKVKAREVHEDIKLEMLGHLEERIEDKLIAGDISEEEAIADAIDQMGDPEQIGKQLHAAHKPRMEWTLLGICMLLIGIGLVAMLTVLATGEVSLGDHFLEKKLFFVALGLGAMVCLYFIDYRKIQRYSWHLYGFTLVLLAAASSAGKMLNGTKEWIEIGPLNVNVGAASPYLFMVAFAGILSMGRATGVGGAKKNLWLLLRDIIVFFLLPTFFYLSTSSLVNYSIYCFGSLLLLLFVGKKYKLAIVGFGALLVIALWIVQRSDKYQYVWWRLKGFIYPNADSSYQTVRSIEAIQNGGMWGQGFGAVNERLPFYYGEMLYSYLIYSLGWMFGFVIGVLAFLFIGRVVGMALKLKDRFAKGIIVGIVSVMGVKFLWNLLMCFGLLPILSIEFPLISWGFLTFIELAAVGLMLGAYRRKDILVKSANYLSSQKI